MSKKSLQILTNPYKILDIDIWNDCFLFTILNKNGFSIISSD